MSRWRIFVLLFGPVPIVAVSIGLTAWVRSGPAGIIADNRVWAAEETGGGTPKESDDAKSETLRKLQSYLDDKCRETADRLRPQLGAECTVAVHPPFVVAGDMTADELDQRYQATIAPAARAMANSYFRKPPTLPITILLFASEASYNRYAKQLFNDEGVSVYGYYIPDKRTLVMNIGTGGGTLVHEMTHALVAFDFPEIPSWFNEGLASLHEQCRFLPDDRGLEGLVNWRLPGLQEAIRQGRLGTLEQMMTRDDFRGTLVGLNYAQARYLCLYLQHRGQLEEFYRRFRGAQAKDRQGTATLRELLGETAWTTLDRDFQGWVAALKN